jgi:hypothetical protein
MDDPLAFVLKGSLIQKVLFFLVPSTTQGAKSLPCAESLNFPPMIVNNLFKLSAQGSDLALFIGYGNKVKIPSKIKPP